MTFQEFKKQNYEPERMRELECEEMLQFIKWYCDGDSRTAIAIINLMRRNGITDLNSLAKANIDELESYYRFGTARKLVVRKMQEILNGLELL